MNNYDNNHDGVNNNYDQSYKQEGEGQYSYSYTPKDTKKIKTRAMVIKYIIIAMMSIMISFMTILPGIVFGALAIKNFFGEGKNGTSAATIGGESKIGDHGISAIDVTSENLYYYSQYGITSTGVIVTNSEYTDELIFGDKIISVNGVDISVSEDIEQAMNDCSVGDEITLTVERKGETLAVCIILRERAADYVDFE